MFLVYSRLRFHEHVRSVTRKTGELLRSIIWQSPSFLMSWFVSHIRLIIDIFSSVWNVGYLGDVRLLESIQRRWSQPVADIGHLGYDERLKELRLFSIYSRLLRTGIIKGW